MAVMNLVCVAVALVVVGVFVVWELCRPVDKKWGVFGRKMWKLPPGPKGDFLVGNMSQFFRARDSGGLIPYLNSLGEYGEMTTLRMGSRTWVLLNSDRVIADVMLKHGRVTNERPYMPIASGLVSQDNRNVIRQTAHWHEGRRVMHHLLSGSALSTYGDWYETESVRLLAAYESRPQQWFAHNFRYTTSVLFRLVFGDPFQKSKAELDEYQRVTMEFLFSLNRHFVDFFPWLAKIPTVLQFWAPRWRRMGEFHRRVFLSWWTPVAEAVDAGVASPSFVRDTLLHPDTKFTGSREEAMYVATSIIAAGGDNIRMVTNTFMMAMISYPDALKRLQAELDTFYGSGENLKLPNSADMASLPYCAATIKEVLRWRTIVPLQPQHHLTKPLEYDGYSFPAGTDFLINFVALQGNEWKDPDVFRPERFIDGGNELNLIHNFWGFGAGRRICVGHKVAQLSLFVAITRIAYCFDVVAAGEFDDTCLNHQTLSEPFPIKIAPRSEAHRKLILQAAAEIQDSGYVN